MTSSHIVVRNIGDDNRHRSRRCRRAGLRIFGIERHGLIDPCRSTRYLQADAQRRCQVQYTGRDRCRVVADICGGSSAICDDFIGASRCSPQRKKIGSRGIERCRNIGIDRQNIGVRWQSSEKLSGRDVWIIVVDRQTVVVYRLRGQLASRNIAVLIDIESICDASDRSEESDQECGFFQKIAKHGDGLLKAGC